MISHAFSFDRFDWLALVGKYFVNKNNSVADEDVYSGPGRDLYEYE